MKRRYLYSIAVLLISFFFAACSDNEEGISDADLNVTPASVAFDNETNTATVTVEFEGAWIAALSDTTWCTLDKHSSEGLGEIVVTLKPRESLEPQKADLTITAVEAPEVFKVVTLSLGRLDFYADPIRVEFGLGDHVADTIDVVCAGSWTVELTDAPWCTIDKTSGNGNDRIVITSQGDKTTWGNESALLTITSVENPSLQATVDVKQLNEYQHGSCITLNKATKGRGIDVVISGDAFVKADMTEDGLWQEIAHKAGEAILTYEPYKSFREYFNIYAVTAISETNEISVGQPSNTFYGIYDQDEADNTLEIPNMTQNDIYQFLYDHTPISKEKDSPQDMVVLMVANCDKYAGVGYMRQSSTEIASGFAIVTTWHDDRRPFEEYFFPLIGHEFCGHSFGKLADEYGSWQETITEEEKQGLIREKERFGYNQNVQLTNNPEEFDNPYWAKLLEMNYPDVGIVEGGYYNDYGVWRSIEDNMMRHQTDNPFFGPVNREIILRTIYQLAGMEDQYSLEVFLEYDKINLK